MPAVLVEIGFLTNPDEEQQLVSDGVPGRPWRRRSSTASSASANCVEPGATSADRRARAAPGAAEAPMTQGPRDRAGRRARAARSAAAVAAAFVVLPRWYLRTGRHAGTRRARGRARDAEDQGAALLRVRGRPAAGRRWSARCRSARARSRRRGASSRRSSSRPPPPLVSAIPAGTTLRAIYLGRAGRGVRRPEPRGRRRRTRAARSTRSSRYTRSSTP